MNIGSNGTFRTGAVMHKSESVIMIPVVVHVVYRNATENVSDAVIRNQIEILNNDFRRINSDRVNTPSDFSTLASDTR